MRAAFIMRTTITLALVTRLLRRAARAGPPAAAPPLAMLPGRPILELANVSALLAAPDGQRRAERGLP
jgi:hypothetical protein